MHQQGNTYTNACNFCPLISSYYYYDLIFLKHSWTCGDMINCAHCDLNKFSDPLNEIYYLMLQDILKMLKVVWNSNKNV